MSHRGSQGETALRTFMFIYGVSLIICNIVGLCRACLGLVRFAISMVGNALKTPNNNNGLYDSGPKGTFAWYYLVGGVCTLRRGMRFKVYQDQDSSRFIIH